MTLKSDAKFEEKPTCGLENDMRNLKIFTRALESIKIGTLMGSFCPKCKMYELKIYKGVMCHDNEEWHKNWRGIDLPLMAWEIWWILTRTLESLKICVLMGSLRPKYLMFNLKCRGIIFHGTEEWCKIWRRTDLRFQKWHEEFAEFWLEHSKT